MHLLKHLAESLVHSYFNLADSQQVIAKFKQLFILDSLTWNNSNCSKNHNFVEKHQNQPNSKIYESIKSKKLFYLKQIRIQISLIFLSHSVILF